MEQRKIQEIDWYAFEGGDTVKIMGELWRGAGTFVWREYTQFEKDTSSGTTVIWTLSHKLTNVRSSTAPRNSLVGCVPLVYFLLDVLEEPFELRRSSCQNPDLLP